MYSPKIKPELVRKLYRLKQSRQNKKPMTFYVNEAVEKYLKQQENKDDKTQNEDIDNKNS